MLFLLLVAQNCLYNIDDYVVNPTQCDPNEDGILVPGNQGSWTDYLPLYQEISNQLNELCYTNGGVIQFGAGCYYFSGPIDVENAVTITGVSGIGMGATRLVFTEDSVGVHTYNKGGAILRNVFLQSLGGSSLNAHGLHIESRTHTENVTVRWFPANGLEAKCDINANPPSNCNLSSFYNSDFVGNGGWGIHADDGDANAMVFYGGNISSNYTGEILEESFQGNRYFGVHIASPYAQVAIDADNSLNNRSQFVGLYVEHPAVVRLGKYTAVMGNTGGGVFSGYGLLLDDNIVRNGDMSFDDKNGKTTMTIGDSNGTSGWGIAEFYNQADAGQHRLQFGWKPMGYTMFEGWWGWCQQNLGSLCSLMFASNRVTGPGEARGQVWVRSQMFLGAGEASHSQQRIQFDVCDTAPSHVPVGPAICWNVSTSSVVGWRFDGSTWSSF